MKKNFLPLISILWSFQLSCSASPVLYVMPQPDSLAEQALVLSIQGLNASNSDNRIWIDPGSSWIDWVSVIGKDYGYSIVNLSSHADGPSSFLEQAARLARKCSSSYRGYILCDMEGNPDSLYVALSLAGPMRMLVVDQSIRKEFLRELEMASMLDVRNKDIQSLLHEYADHLDWNGFSYPNSYDRISSADWCILKKWPIFFTRDRQTAEAFMRRTQAGSLVITWHPPYEITGSGAPEDRFISYFSQRGLSIIPGVLMRNLSTLSSIARVTPDDSLRQSLPSQYQIDKDKHYVAFFLNSGGNLGYLHGRYLNETNRGDRSNWMNRAHNFPVSISMSLAAIDFSPLALRTIYGMKSGQDCFLTPFSGHSYIHPSQFNDLDGFVKQLDHYLALADQHVVAIQENKMIEIDENWMRKFGSTYLDMPNINGLFVMNKPWGKVLWHTDKPVITKRFGMRIGDNDENISNLAANLNKQVADIQSEKGYSIIHVDLEQTSFEDMQHLVDQLEPHIQVVNLEELVYHVTQNVRH